MIKLQFKLPQALISRGFTRRTVFHAPAFQLYKILLISKTNIFARKNKHQRKYQTDGKDQSKNSWFSGFLGYFLWISGFLGALNDFRAFQGFQGPLDTLHRFTKIDQANLWCTIEKWKAEQPNDSFFYRSYGKDKKYWYRIYPINGV